MTTGMSRRLPLKWTCETQALFQEVLAKMDPVAATPEDSDEEVQPKATKAKKQKKS